MPSGKTAVPVLMPDDLAEQIRQTAQETDLSQQDVIRQSIKFGLVKVRETHRGTKPFTREEARQAFGPDPEWDELEARMARRRIRRPEAD